MRDGGVTHRGYLEGAILRPCRRPLTLGILTHRFGLLGCPASCRSWPNLVLIPNRTARGSPERCAVGNHWECGSKGPDPCCLSSPTSDYLSRYLTGCLVTSRGFLSWQLVGAPGTTLEFAMFRYSGRSMLKPPRSVFSGAERLPTGMPPGLVGG